MTGLLVGVEGMVLSSDPTTERLISGDVSGKPISNPRSNLPSGSAFVPYPAGRRSFSIPPTVPTSLLVNWMDFSAPGIGVGTGYLNAQEMDMVGDVRAQAEGLNLGWRFFRLEGTRGFMWGINGPQQIYALAPGEQFTSDEWIIVVHDGDWHNTAAAYRKRYEQAFRGDFLDWDRTSPTVRQNDIIINGFIAWGKKSTDKSRAYDFPDGVVITRFDAVAERVRDALAKLDLHADNAIVNLLGTGTHWGIYKMPDHFPMVEAAGGQAAGEKMAADLRQMGIAGLCFYAHPYFHHRNATNYEPAAETGWNYPHMDWHTSMGGIACMGEASWQRLWRERIIPQFVSSGVTGLYVDEGFGHQFICTRPNHSHGGSAVAILTAQTRGATGIYKEFRKQAGTRGFLQCETAGDLQARWIDLWDFNPNSTLRFTHPDHMMMTHVNRKAISESVAHALIYGCPLMIRALPSALSPQDILEGELLDAARSFVAIRREMREKRAPGYPQGFRDGLGLEVTGNLQAKLFTDGTAITVAYYAPEEFDGSLTVRGEAAGVPGVRRVVRPLRLKAKQMGYLVIRG